MSSAATAYPIPEMSRIADAARAMLSWLFDPGAPASERHARLLALRPRAEDYDRVFRPGSVARARAGYETMWADPQSLPECSADASLDLTVFRAESLLSGDVRDVPSGYRDVADELHDEVVLVCADLVDEGESSGISVDGFVPLGDRWAWFPKPWRFVPSLVVRTLTHWTE